MTIAQLENSEDYSDFNNFFTRALKPEARPIVKDPNAIASPVDGTVSQIGCIQEDSLIQAKGFHFSLQGLLGGAPRIAKQFENGYFSTIYLSPKDYHRVHMPIRGTLTHSIYIPGKLFSVNPLTTSTVPSLFSRNERLVCLFETEVGPMAVILVGAMLVASINTTWRTASVSTTVTTSLPPYPVVLERGAELGHFKLGSTVIVLFPKDTIKWESMIKEGSSVQMGQLVGSIQQKK